MWLRRGFEEQKYRWPFQVRGVSALSSLCIALAKRRGRGGARGEGGSTVLSVSVTNPLHWVLVVHYAKPQKGPKASLQYSRHIILDNGHDIFLTKRKRSLCIALLCFWEGQPDPAASGPLTHCGMWIGVCGPACACLSDRAPGPQTPRAQGNDQGPGPGFCTCGVGQHPSTRSTSRPDSWSRKGIGLRAPTVLGPGTTQHLGHRSQRARVSTAGRLPSEGEQPQGKGRQAWARGIDAAGAWA